MVLLFLPLDIFEEKDVIEDRDSFFSDGIRLLGTPNEAKPMSAVLSVVTGIGERNIVFDEVASFLVLLVSLIGLFLSSLHRILVVVLAFMEFINWVIRHPPWPKLPVSSNSSGKRDAPSKAACQSTANTTRLAVND